MKSAKRPSRWALRNWPVRGKVLAIVLVPLVLACVFGGFRIHASATEAAELRRAAERADMVPAVVDYMAGDEIMTQSRISNWRTPRFPMPCGWPPTPCWITGRT